MIQSEEIRRAVEGVTRALLVGEELVNLQVLLALWRRAWPEVERSRTQRALLSVQARQWSDRVMQLANG